MSTTEAVFALFEQGLNRYIRLDPDALEQFKALHGRMIQIHIQGLELDFFMAPAPDGIQVYPRYEGEPDCVLSGPPSAFLRLGQEDTSADELFQGHAQIRGNTELGQAFGDILGALDIDWEEQLARLTGDIPAHGIGKRIRAAKHWSKQTAKTLPMDLGEYLREELRLLPGPLETGDFLNDVDTLRDDTERLAARIARLRSVLDGKGEEQP